MTMLRRRFLMFLGVLAFPLAAMVLPSRKARGVALPHMHRVYRRSPDGRWLRCGLLAVKPGDVVLAVGGDPNEIWMLRRETVGEGGGFVDAEGVENLMTEGPGVNLLQAGEELAKS